MLNHFKKNADMNDTPNRTTDPAAVYRRLLGIVEHNTGGPQPPMAWERSIRTIAGHAGLDSEAVGKAIRAARGNGDLITVTRDGRRLARTDEDSIRAVLEWEVERDDPSKELVAKCNRALDVARGVEA